MFYFPRFSVLTRWYPNQRSLPISALRIQCFVTVSSSNITVSVDQSKHFIARRGCSFSVFGTEATMYSTDSVPWRCLYNLRRVRLHLTLVRTTCSVKCINMDLTWNLYDLCAEFCNFNYLECRSAFFPAFLVRTIPFWISKWERFLLMDLKLSLFRFHGYRTFMTIEKTV